MPSIIDEMHRLATELGDLGPDIQFSTGVPRGTAYKLAAAHRFRTARPDPVQPWEREGRDLFLVHPETMLEGLGLSRERIKRLPRGWQLAPVGFPPVPRPGLVILSWRRLLSPPEAESLRDLPPHIHIRLLDAS